jgi:hypothetical protein
LFEYAIHFGWTPDQVDRLTLDQHRMYAAGFDEMERQAKAQEREALEAKRRSGQ